jgi:hypothetical protein
MRTNPFFTAALPLLLLLACGGSDPQSGGLNQTSEQLGGGASSGAAADGGGRLPCERSSDCAGEEVCAFRTGIVCATSGRCLPKGSLVCNLADLGCACDGTTISIECAAGLPPGYSPKPLEHKGACANTCTSGSAGNAGGTCSADLGFFQSAETRCAADGHLTTFVPDEKCGSGSSSSATYTCCSHAPIGCVSGGGANANGACSSNEAFFASAEASCESAHLSITTFSTDDKCGPDSSNSFTYSCCP